MGQNVLDRLILDNDGRVTLTYDIAFYSGHITGPGMFDFDYKSGLDSIKAAIASVLGISPSDISIKTIGLNNNGFWSLEVKIQTTAYGATAIQVKITSSAVNIQLVE